jgi:hypothetical protein
MESLTWELVLARRSKISLLFFSLQSRRAGSKEQIIYLTNQSQLASLTHSSCHWRDRFRNAIQSSWGDTGIKFCII